MINAIIASINWTSVLTFLIFATGATTILLATIKKDNDDDDRHKPA